MARITEFDVRGDEISYRNIPLATINGRAWPTLRAEAISELLDGPDGWITEENHTEAMEEEFKRGQEDAKEDAAPLKQRMIELIEDAVATIEAEENDDNKHWLGQAAAILKLAKAD